MALIPLYGVLGLLFVSRAPMAGAKHFTNVPLRKRMRTKSGEYLESVKLRDVARDKAIIANATVDFGPSSVARDAALFVAVRLTSYKRGNDKNVGIDGRWQKVVCVAGVRCSVSATANFSRMIEDRGVWLHVVATAVGGEGVNKNNDYVQVEHVSLTYDVISDPMVATIGPWLYQDRTADYLYEGVRVWNFPDYDALDGAKLSTKQVPVYKLRIPNVKAGDKLRLFGEVTLSRCNRKDILGLSGDNFTTPCHNDERMVANPYPWDKIDKNGLPIPGYIEPRFFAEMHIFHQNKEDGNLFQHTWVNCTEELHHCTLSLPQKEYVATKDGTHYAYLMVTSSSEDESVTAKPWHVIEVEEGKGHISVNHVPQSIADDVDVRAFEEKTGQDSEFYLAQHDNDTDEFRPRFQVPVSLPLGALPAFAVVEVAAPKIVYKQKLHTKFCSPLVGITLVLTSGAPQSWEWPKNSPPALPGMVSVGSLSAQNCPYYSQGSEIEDPPSPAETTCVFSRSGVVQLGAAGIPDAYVSIGVRASRTCLKENNKDQFKIEKNTKLEASVVSLVEATFFP